METMLDKTSNLNTTKDVKKGKAKGTGLRDVIRKYLENPINSESAVNKGRDHEDETKNIKSKSIISQNERDSKQKIIENVTDSFNLKNPTTDVRKALNCQNVSKDEEKSVKSKMLAGHATITDHNSEIRSHTENPSNQFRNTEKVGIPGARFKVANLDVSMEGTAEMIGKDIAAKLDEPRVDMVVALVEVVGTEAALHIFKETQKVEAGGGMMVKNGARRRTPGGTFFQLIREARNPNIDKERVNLVFGRLNEVEKTDSDCVEKKGSVKLDRPCDYFNDTGICKFNSGHFSQSGFTRRIHSCRFCFYRHEVENSHPEIHCGLYRSYLNSLDSTFQLKEEHSNKIQNGDVPRQSKATAAEKILTCSNAMSRNSGVTSQSKATAAEKILTGSNAEPRNGDVARQSKAIAIEKILTGSNAMPQNSHVTREFKATAAQKILTGSNTILQNSGVTSQSKATAAQKILTGFNTIPQNGQFKANVIEKILTGSNADVTRQSKATAAEKILTGSNAMPIGVRSCPTEEKKRVKGTVEQEDMRNNSVRSAHMSAREESGMIFQTKKFSPLTGQAPSDVERKSSNVCRTEVGRATNDVVSGYGYQRSKRIVPFQNGLGRKEDMKNTKEKDMKNAKEKLTMLSDKISKSVLNENQDYQAKKNLELVEFHSSLGKSMVLPKTDELALKNNKDCKIDSQKSKDKKRKGKSCDKCINKSQGKVKQGEISENNVEKKKFLQDVNGMKSQNIGVDKQEVNESSEEKQHNKAKLKDKCESKKEIAKNETIRDTAKEKEKKPVNGEGCVSKKELFTKKCDNDKTETGAVNDREKMQSIKFEENKKENCNIDKEMQMPETKLSSSKTKSVDFLQLKNPVAHFPHSKLANSFNSVGNRMTNLYKGYGNRMANSTKGDENRKQRLHCPCPPYCPNCLNIVKIKNLG